MSCVYWLILIIADKLESSLNASILLVCIGLIYLIKDKKNYKDNNNKMMKKKI